MNKDSVGTQTTAGPSIDTKQVKTEVLVENGGTVGIGGIYTQNEHDRHQGAIAGRHPDHRLPVPQRAEAKRRNELLIFITPRIVATT